MPQSSALRAAYNAAGSREYPSNGAPRAGCPTLKFIPRTELSPKLLTIVRFPDGEPDKSPEKSCCARENVMVKRKRSEPRLEENLQKWEKELVRGLKAAKGFERQRYAKRQREADPEKAARLEREIVVLKSIDLHQCAHQHLCSSLLRIKGVADAPNLPEAIKPVPKPDLTDDERTALHNVTSALCNRKQVKDVIDEAIMGTCIALRVPMPEKKGKGKGKNDRKDPEQQADDVKNKVPAEKPAKKAKQASEDEEEQEQDAESWDGFGSEAGEDLKGLAGIDDEEKAFSRFDDMLGSSSEDDDGNGSDGDEAGDSRAKSIRGPSDYFSGSSAGEESEGDDEESDGEENQEDDDEEDDEESDASAISPPPKRAKSKAAKPEPASSGNSTFLPSLMGGYISGSESEASDIDVAPPLKKNRRGQRARQAIWEKKFKKEANHVRKQQERSSRDEGWDMKKGAVGGEEDSGPWKKGIRNPFEKKSAPEGVHPDRQANFDQQEPERQQRPERPQRLERQSRPEREQGSERLNRSQRRAQLAASGSLPIANHQRDEVPKRVVPKPQPKPQKDDEGPLHASWAAAKAAKEAAQKVAFQGKKITFD
ncbi:Bud-site selection protein [Truncatella angustata]|uniref:Bud-site selection protein n=1 Tax=Truncatella angustata TaxID=152316 RepID=A0A9P8RJW2_9PEZI|nr:Bud-site selection protein [Truncatella angustata]KAH6647410.1 Bud-site selection protein [Truncatella angustata]